jgi:uncharacterized damage-inducible protein DinB
MSVDQIYLEEIRKNFWAYKKLAEGAFAQLKDEEFFQMIDPEANSIAIIIKHMAGNAHSRFTDFLTSDGEKPNRQRDQEFIIGERTTRADLMHWWEHGWRIVLDAVEDLKTDDLEKTITIRSQPHTVVQALQRALAHYAYHIGQIVLLAKHIRGAEWKSLSVPKGKSEEFNREMNAKKGKGAISAVSGVRATLMEEKK